MRLGESARMQAAINITPLVDVVLVLLIIFMVMAPEMRKGPDVNLPNTTKPNEQGDERGRILVSIDDAGGLWINDQRVAAEHFGEALSAAVGAEKEPRVVHPRRRKAQLPPGPAGHARDRAGGFRGVGLIAKRAGAEGRMTSCSSTATIPVPSLQSEINITPLVDVVLVLLIIFMVVVPLLMQGYDVNIPRASADAYRRRPQKSQLILSIGPATCPILAPPAREGSRRTVR